MKTVTPAGLCLFILFIVAGCRQPIDRAPWQASIDRAFTRFEQLDTDPALLSDRGWVSDTVVILEDAAGETQELARQLPPEERDVYQRLRVSLNTAAGEIRAGNVIGILQAIDAIQEVTKR